MLKRLRPYKFIRYELARAYRYSSSFPKIRQQQKVSSLLKYFKKTKRRSDLNDPTHPSNVLYLEICDFLKSYSKQVNLNITDQEVHNSYDIIKSFLPFQRKDHIISNVKISGISHNGDGIAIIPKSIYASEYLDSDSVLGKYTVLMVPKTIVGDKIKVLLKMHYEFYAEGELIEILNKSSSRERNILCEHFQECNGCQLQMSSYSDQLIFKQNTIKKAFDYFHPSLKVENDFGAVIPSPLQYSYRTKITPHFESNGDECTKLGYKHVNNRGKIDVEHCSIATIELNDKLKEVRKKYMGNKSMRQLTLRQSLRINKDTGEFHEIALEGPKEVVTEKVEGFVYQFDSSCFFQNNNAILPSVLDYIRFHIDQLNVPVKNVVDTYCGVGFFGIALSNLSSDINIFGIEISESSIKYANHNSKINGLDPDRTKFILGDASNIFNNEEFRRSNIKGDGSVVIIDPSRKGSDSTFLKQLLDFEPEMIVYISCNVFTQARDLSTFENLQGDHKKYDIVDVKGFDFFPQTKHVESVAILKKCK
ncbi:uncharacterized protein KGF55_000203 [Candida pseudojiufengensis]|uniref:uncharacterized protein n=1 Tax=Candida pseudojiufengensis TaxID=497109 RepID=UPI0022249ABC|nr:uncharacterized protein KGF55_000203 [Candida pseudojiufengensis]KAI5966794.1 hypothetical protein KGF55_000203 [Candida pseudojiufengensis]